MELETYLAKKGRTGQHRGRLKQRANKEAGHSAFMGALLPLPASLRTACVLHGQWPQHTGARQHSSRRAAGHSSGFDSDQPEFATCQCFFAPRTNQRRHRRSLRRDAPPPRTLGPRDLATSRPHQLTQLSRSSAQLAVGQSVNAGSASLRMRQREIQVRMDQVPSGSPTPTAAGFRNSHRSISPHVVFCALRRATDTPSAIIIPDQDGWYTWW